MGRKRTNKVNKTSKKQKVPVKQGTGFIEEQMEAFGHRMLSIFCGVAIAGSFLFLVFFFSSDMRDNIIGAKTSQIHAAQSSQSVKSDVAGVSVSDLVDALNNSAVNRDEIILQLNRMSDEEFRAFVDKVTKQSESKENAEQPSQDKVASLYERLIQGEQTGKSDMIDQLNNMSEAEFNAFIDRILTAIQESSGASTEVEKAPRGTLEEAYAEAERRYQGQIDGSKRLKRVQELNATSYTYYVAEEGDTLIQLSRAFDVPLGQLVELNGIHDADEIPAGMILLFPFDTEQPNNP